MTSGFRGSAAFAIRLAQAKGEIDASKAILWQRDRDTPYVPSPLLYEGVFYLVESNSGILTALDAKTGETLWGPRAAREHRRDLRFSRRCGGPGLHPGARRERARSRLGPGPSGPFQELPRRRLRRFAGAGGKEMYLRGYRHLYKLAGG